VNFEKIDGTFNALGGTTAAWGNWLHHHCQQTITISSTSSSTRGKRDETEALLSNKSVDVDQQLRL